MKSIGGEFGFIRMIRRKPRNKNALVGIGDDAAVMRFGGKKIGMLVKGYYF